MCVQFYVCDNIPFPLVGVSRLLIQDFWTVMSKDFMALMTPNHQALPIVRQGALAYLTPTVIPYDRYSGPKTELEICSLRQEIDLTSLDSELRGISDVQNCQYDHLSKIADLIAASSGHPDFWKVHEIAGRLVRHHIRKRTVFFDFSNVRGKAPVDVSLSTGKRETFKQYSEGFSKKIVDEDFKKHPARFRIDPKEWIGNDNILLHTEGSIEEEASKYS